MTNAARSSLVFGIYLTGTAIMLVAAPNVLIGTIGMAPTSDSWIHVLGIVVGSLGAYYIVAARANLVPFFHATVWVRIIVLAGFSALALLEMAPMRLILFGVVDALGAIWTWMALRSDAKGA